MKKTLSILGIILIALLLRLIFINKPDGLWNDEYISYFISSIPIKEGFFKGITWQCHMPLYYIYLKFFMSIFGNSDLLLRLTSVFAGILSIPVMYLVGNEYGKKCGFLCAGFTAISSFLIYFSQEVRLYSLLFLLSATCTLYTLRFIKNQNKINLFLCILFNILVIFTHTIGFVFVFFNLIFISLNTKNKKIIAAIWTFITIFSGAALPLIIKILSGKTFSQWWGHFSISKIGFLFTDYFSPVQTNITNAPDNFFYAPKLAVFMIIPALIAIICIFKSLVKNKLNQQLFGIFFGVISTLVLASLLGKLVFITKYSIEIYPILILLACYGVTLFDNKAFRNFLIITYSAISLGYILIHPYSAPKMHRAEGHKIVTDMFNRMDLKCGDYILFEYYGPERFNKYFDFSCYNTVTINKGNFPEYISPGIDYGHAYSYGKEIYRGLFLTNGNEYLHSRLKKEIFDNLQNGQNVVMVILDSVAFYNPEELINIAKNETVYKKTPLLYLVFSYLKKEVFLDLAQQLAVTRIENKGKWTTVKFTKLNKSTKL